MAYYNSVYSSESNYGEYNFNSYAVNYDYDQVPQFVTCNSNEYNQSNYGYDSSLYFSSNFPEPDHSYQTIAYSTTIFNEPKSIVYEPNYGMTQLVLSYNTLEFNEPAYDEYDPTPYGGGYDISVTYGKPLPPSDKICYPPFGSNSIPVTSVKEDPIDETAMKPQSQEDSTISTKDIKPYESEESESESESEKSDHEDGYGSEIGDGYIGEQFDGYEKQVASQYPSGYGLESLDLCESLFGHWPCLSRMKRRENCCEGAFFDRGNNWQENMWKGTADYLFGNPYPYGGNGSSYGGGELVYGYERHYPIQAQTQYKQIDYTYE